MAASTATTSIRQKAVVMDIFTNFELPPTPLSHIIIILRHTRKGDQEAAG